jgi:hypothetical protein
VGTPEILLTVVFPVVTGYVFAAVYLKGVMLLTRDTAQAVPVSGRRGRRED